MMVESSPGTASSGRLGPGQPRTPRSDLAKRSLVKVLRERGTLSTAHAVDVTLDICDALAVAHANGVFHGQLGLGCVRLAFTPETGPRDVEIFTLASDGDSGVAGQAGPFLVPEHGFGGSRGLERVVDARVDVWALGALLYTMLVGESPGRGTSNAVDVVGARAPEGSMPASLATIVEACLSPDPAQRPASVDAIAEAIASYASNPPDRFVCLAERRERRERAARARERLALRGLAEMPGILDKLDDAALLRAQREPVTTPPISSVLGTSTEAAMERLMTAVHEGTEAARVQLASGLSSLVDFDDEDEELLPTVVQEETVPLTLAPVACPLSTVPVVLPDAPSQPAPLPPEAFAPLEAFEAAGAVQRAPAVMQPVPALAPGAPPRLGGRGLRALAWTAAVAMVVCLCGYVGYVASATATATPAAPAPTVAAIAPVTTPPAAAAAPAEIPVIAASALPDVAPITPAQLREAR